MCSFLILFIYPCAESFTIALQFAWNFSFMIVFYHMSRNIIAKTTPIFFHQIHIINIIQNEYCVILIMINCSVSFIIKRIEKLYFELAFVPNLVVIRYFSKKSIVNMNDLNLDSIDQCQPPSVFC